MTEVALMTATASAPGSSPRSRTASADINETTRWGPDWMSTCAITPSCCTRVTSPTNRLRALERTSAGSAAAWASATARAASASPGISTGEAPVVGRMP